MILALELVATILLLYAMFLAWATVRKFVSYEVWLHFKTKEDICLFNKLPSYNIMMWGYPTMWTVKQWKRKIRAKG